MFTPIKLNIDNYLEKRQKEEVFNYKISDIFNSNTFTIDYDGIIKTHTSIFINITYIKMLIKYNNYELFDKVLKYDITMYHKYILECCIESMNYNYIYKCVQYIKKHKVNTNIIHKVSYCEIIGKSNIFPINNTVNIVSQLGLYYKPIKKLFM